MTRRAGATLIEVLVAIFVMALGLLALLTLFPLGALSMAQAIKDDRAAVSAGSSTSIAATLGLRSDQTVITGLNNTNDVFVDPNPLGTAKGNLLPVRNPDDPGYPVYVDPRAVGFNTQLGLSAPFVGIPRRSVDIVANAVTPPPSQQLMRWFTGLDDMPFVKDGPNLGAAYTLPGPPPIIARDNLYSWAYMLHRPHAGLPNYVNLTVVVYRSRPLVFGLGERTYTGVLFGSPSTNTVTLGWAAGQDRPAIKKGGWICDATMLDEGDASLKPARPPTPHGFFYRVLATSDTGPNQIVLELQTDVILPTAQGVLVTMDGVAEVFEKGTGWAP